MKYKTATALNITEAERLFFPRRDTVKITPDEAVAEIERFLRTGKATW